MELKADLTAQNQESLSLKIETAIDLIQARSDLQRKYIKALRDSEECECMDGKCLIYIYIHVHFLILEVIACKPLGIVLMQWLKSHSYPSR